MWATSQLVAHAPAMGTCRSEAEAGTKTRKNVTGSAKTPSGDGVVKPPGEEEEAGDDETEQRLHLARANGTSDGP